MFGTKNHKPIKNLIPYVAPKRKAIFKNTHLSNMISCVVGTSISGFDKYWQTVLRLMELNTIPTFKHIAIQKMNSKKIK